MTLIMGIKAYSSESNSREIILAGDSMVTSFEENEKIPVSKLTGFNKISRGKYWAMGFAGTYTPTIRTFFRNLKSEDSSKNIIENAIRTKYFREVNEFNTHIAKKYGEDCSVHFLLASSKPKLGIYMVDRMGNILEEPIDEDFEEDYIFIGSGSEFAKRYFEKKLGNKYLDRNEIGHSLAINSAYESVNKNEDPFTSGPVELIIVKENKIINLGSKQTACQRRDGKTSLDNLIEETG
jgi:20S proteasome alpha/beta subunit